MPETHAANALPVGTMIQEYRILRALGAGSFGIVYQAENVYLDEVVAIKEFLPSDLACRTEGTRVVPLSSTTEEPYVWALRQFLKEARILWDLARPARHPNIVRISRFHEDNGTAYMVMDFEEGRSLAAVLDEHGTLPEPELLTILYPLLDGLERVHDAAVWHRDIKPANILIRPDGSPVFIDFGAARQDRGDQARSVMAMYSPAYAAPEQVMSLGEQGPWTDIYSLAATLYRAVTGKAPTSVPERALGMAHVPAAEAGRGRYSPALLRAIDEALSLQPRDRPQSVAEWRRMLQSPASGIVQPDGEATVLAASPAWPAAAATAGTRSVASDRGKGSILLSTPPATAAQPVPPAVTSGQRRPWGLAFAVSGILILAALAYLLVRPWLWPTPLDRGAAIGPAQTEQAVEPARPPPPLAPQRSDARAVGPTEQLREPPIVADRPPTVPAVNPPASTAPTMPPPETAPASTGVAPQLPAAAPTPPPEATPDYAAVAAAISDVIAGFDCADLSATLSADSKVYVSGRVSNAAAQRTLESRLGALEGVKSVVSRTEILESPFCDAMETLGLTSSRRAPKGPEITVNSPTRTFREGQYLMVEVTAGPAHRGHLYVDYLDSAGNFVHMLPSPFRDSNAVAPGQRITLGAEGTDLVPGRQYEIAPPHGRGMIIALTSRKPLFDRPRPEVEHLAEYLPALDAKLAQLDAEGGTDEVTVSTLLIETRP